MCRIKTTATGLIESFEAMKANAALKDSAVIELSQGGAQRLQGREWRNCCA